MSSNLKGPGVFLAQGWGKPGWQTLEECARTAASLGYRGLQCHLWNGGPINTELAATSKAYCDDMQAVATNAGCPIVEVANHCDTQLVRCTPAYLKMHSWPAPKHLHGNPAALAEWAANRAKLSVAAAANFGFKNVAAFSGTGMFHTMYPWPQRPKGLVTAGYHALAKAWRPILDFADLHDVTVRFEIHPGEDLHDGDSFEQWLPYVKHHSRAGILLDLSHFVLSGMRMTHMLGYINQWKDRIGMFHVKDGEFQPTPGGGVYGGFNDWRKRPSRFRSLGDGQIDYPAVFALLQTLGLDLWATVEWECAFKPWNQGVSEAAKYVEAWMNGTEPPAKTEPEVSSDTFDDFAGGGGEDVDLLAEILGIPRGEVELVVMK